MNPFIYLSAEFVVLAVIFFIIHRLISKNSKYEKQNLISDIKLKDSQLQEKDSEISSLKRKKENLSSALEALENNFNDLRIKNAAFLEKINSLERIEQEFHFLKDSYNKIQDERNNLANQQTALEVELNEIKKGNSEKIEELKEARDSFKKEFENLANRIFEKKNENSKNSIATLISPFKEQLTEFNRKVEKFYHNEASDRKILTHEIDKLKKLNLRISEDAINLTKALKGDTKIQGDWGEVVLERILEQSGLIKGEMFETQLSFSSKNKRYRPDCIVHLPDGKDIIIDAKVSLKAYEEYFNNEENADKFLNQHLISVNNHIKNLSNKRYEDIEEINSLDYILLFIPIEGAYITALKNNRNLFQDALKKNIMIVGPSTLLVTLRTIENFWRFKKQTENVREIADRGEKLYNKFVGFIDSLDEIGKSLEKAGSAYKTAKNRLSDGKGNLIWQAEELKKLGLNSRKEINK